MDTERNRKISEIVKAALQLPPEQRSSYLDQACAGDEVIARYEFDVEQSGPHYDYVRSVAFSPTEDIVATASENILIWDIHTRKKLGRFDYDSIVRSVDFSSDGRWLVSGHRDGSINVWDVQERRRAPGFNGHGDAVRGVSISLDGKYVASAGQDGAVILWKLVWGMGSSFFWRREHGD